jgi:thioredoxin reductase (NADPH)
MTQTTESCDVLVIGAGPAGLTAACYLARFRRKVIVVHDGSSRALRIPLTHNAPGFPGGVAGRELMERMEEQAVLYGAQVRRDHIETLRAEDGGFVAAGAATYRARAVIVATGIQLNEVELPYEAHEAAIACGCLRYCPVCDGYEATGKAVGVLGSDAHGAAEALFLREYTDDVTLLPKVASDLSAAQRAELAGAGIKVLDSPVAELSPGDGSLEVRLEDGRRLRFDVVYPAFGCVPRSELLGQLGLELTADGCVSTDPHQAVAVEGVYAAGDVVEGLDQISVAFGHGAIAATRAHNHLRERDGRVLKSA